MSSLERALLSTRSLIHMYKYAMYVSHVHMNSREGWVTLGPGGKSDWLSRDAPVVVYGCRRETTTEPAGQPVTVMLQ